MLNLDQKKLELMKNILIIFVLTVVSVYSQSSPIQIFVIESFVKDEKPEKYILSFYTTDSCKSNIKLDSKYDYKVSENFDINHKIEINLTEIVFDSSKFSIEIFINDKNGFVKNSNKYYELNPFYDSTKVEENENLLLTCCFGGVVFGLPSPGISLIDGKSFYSLSKEIPIYSWYGFSFNYPSFYIGLEYSYLFESPKKNFVRLGVKNISELPIIEYISPGISVFSDFLGYNGISFETSLGLFKIADVFTVYSKYRFSTNFINNSTDLHEILIGLYGNFFSLNI